MSTAIDAINNANIKGTSSTTTTRKGVKELGVNDFFKLMSAQLQNQTMMNPVDDTQYMSQLAQFTTLEQMKAMASSVASTYMVSLLGKNVTVASTDDNGLSKQVSGKVDSVEFSDGTPMIAVNGYLYNASDVLGVAEAKTK